MGTGAGLSSTALTELFTPLGKYKLQQTRNAAKLKYVYVDEVSKVTCRHEVSNWDAIKR